jgi:hypothetical protein
MLAQLLLPSFAQHWQKQPVIARHCFCPEALPHRKCAARALARRHTGRSHARPMPEGRNEANGPVPVGRQESPALVRNPAPRRGRVGEGFACLQALAGRADAPCHTAPKLAKDNGANSQAPSSFAPEWDAAKTASVAPAGAGDEALEAGRTPLWFAG